MERPTNGSVHPDHEGLIASIAPESRVWHLRVGRLDPHVKEATIHPSENVV